MIVELRLLRSVDHPCVPAPSAVGFWTASPADHFVQEVKTGVKGMTPSEQVRSRLVSPLHVRSDPTQVHGDKAGASPRLLSAIHKTLRAAAPNTQRKAASDPSIWWCALAFQQIGQPLLGLLADPMRRHLHFSASLERKSFAAQLTSAIRYHRSGGDSGAVLDDIVLHRHIHEHLGLVVRDIRPQHVYFDSCDMSPGTIYRLHTFESAVPLNAWVTRKKCASILPLSYRPPEWLVSTHDTTPIQTQPSSDVWSLGLLLAELHATPPLIGGRITEAECRAIHERLTDVIQPLSSMLPEERDLILGMLKHAPEKRPSLGDVLAR
jgi:hypothetical protein